MAGTLRPCAPSLLCSAPLPSGSCHTSVTVFTVLNVVPLLLVVRTRSSTVAPTAPPVATVCPAGLTVVSCPKSASTPTTFHCSIATVACALLAERESRWDECLHYLGLWKAASPQPAEIEKRIAEVQAKRAAANSQPQTQNSKP